jgi:DNA-binding transcriptional MerR regulator/methylmalonyl-CoA mutase cobalamin-binding subunit
MGDNQLLFSIGAVERDTGIGRDTLRVWERRYGFPEPVRNEKGERMYTGRQLRHLQRIRRLLDQGLRPGKLLPLAETRLDELEARLMPEITIEPGGEVQLIIDAIRSADAEKINEMFRHQLEELGMRKFVLDLVTPLLATVGQLWATGKLQIFQEHFLSEQLMRFLHSEIAKSQKYAAKPRVLLATLPGEEHTLGLLMVAAILSSHGITAINLGSEVPMDQIASATEQFHADIVGITFSGAYQYKHIRPHLKELRQLIPDDIEIWTGGEGIYRLRKLPPGVTRIKSLDKLPF